MDGEAIFFTGQGEARPKIYGAGRGTGSISYFATGFQKFYLSWEESILQLYIFIWNMKSKVLDSQQWWSSIIVINLCSCNGLLASEGPDSRVYGSEFNVNVRHIWWMSVMIDVTLYCGCPSLIYDGCPINMNMMDVHHLWIWWMSIIHEWDEFPSCMTYAGIDLVIELKELVKGKQLIRDWMESKEKIRMKKSEPWH